METFCKSGGIMISSNAFSYVNVLDKAADASWLRETVISNNIANVDTPNYKRHDVEFSDVLETELLKTKYGSVNAAVNHLDFSDLNGYEYEDSSNYSYRLDGNSVDIDTENVELASEEIKYQAITSAISQNFSRFDTVTRSS